MRNVRYIPTAVKNAFLYHGATAPSGPRPPLYRGSMITLRHTTLSSGRVISSSQRPLPNNTQHSQQTDIHAPGGVRTHNPSMRAAADPCLIPRGHWDRHYITAGKFSKPLPVHVTKSCKWTGVLSPLFLNHGARWRSGVNFPLWIHKPDERTPRYPLRRRLCLQ